MNALRIFWKFVTSKPLAFALAALFAWMWWQDWSAHKMLARSRAEHYVTITTTKAVTWPTAHFICGGGAVGFVTADLPKKEIERLAREHGLILSETRMVEVPGPERVVEVPVFRDASGQLVRLLKDGEKQVEPAPYGGKAVGGVNEQGGLWLDFKPEPEPYNEKLAQWRLGLSGTWGAAGGSLVPTTTGATVDAKAFYAWRRTGRLVYGPVVGGGYDFGGQGWRAGLGFALQHEQLPLRLRERPKKTE